jgi:hypothetical protein
MKTVASSISVSEAFSRQAHMRLLILPLQARRSVARIYRLGGRAFALPFPTDFDALLIASVPDLQPGVKLGLGHFRLPGLRVIHPLRLAKFRTALINSLAVQVFRFSS